MSEWKEVAISDVADLTVGFVGSMVNEYRASGVRFIRSMNVHPFRIDLSDVKYISEEFNEKISKSQLRPNDVVIVRTGQPGASAVIPEDVGSLNCSDLVIIHPDQSKVDPLFLSAYINLSSGVVASNLVGAVQQHFNVGAAKKMMIKIPDIKTQKRISGLIGRINDKIETNKRINQNVIQQAQMIYKSWFIDFNSFSDSLVMSPAGFEVPESLTMVQIQDLPHILETGKRPKGGAVSEGVPSIGAENVKMLGVFDSSSAKFIPTEYAASMKKGKIEGYELLLYKDGGKPGTFIPHFSMFGEGFPYEEFYINEHVFKLDFHDRGFNEFTYFYMQTDYSYHWLANNGGKAAIPGINQQDVNSIWIYHPSNHKVQEFCKWVQPIFTTIFTNCAQNMKLEKLRDTLLPCLMSGEIDVSNIAV